MNDFVFVGYDPKKHRSYIFKSWLATLHRCPPFFGCRDRLFFPRAQRLLECVIDSPLAKIMVIALTNDPDFIVGFAVFWRLKEHTILWWIHVRDIYREKSICTHILDSIPDKKVAYVFDRKIKDFRVSSILRKRDYEYFPTLMFDALEIGVKNDNRITVN